MRVDNRVQQLVLHPLIKKNLNLSDKYNGKRNICAMAIW